MATRGKLRTGPGARIREARRRKGLDLASLASRSGVSPASLSRFETGKANPGFSDVCAIAAALGWPLLFFAVGRDRTGNDPRDLAAHLAYWGLLDVLPSELPLIGEARPFETLIAEVLARNDVPRILEAVPALLLKTEFSPADLLAEARRTNTLHRLGWIAELAEWISSRVPVANIHPRATSRIAMLREEAWKQRRVESKNDGDWKSLWDSFGSEWNVPEDLAALGNEYFDHEIENLPPITGKWRIRYATPQAQFLERARENLRVADE